MMKSLRHIMAMAGLPLVLSAPVFALPSPADDPPSGDPAAEARTVIPVERLRVYFKKGRVVTGEQLRQAPYVMAGQDGRVLFAAGDTLYVRDPQARPLSLGRRYGLYRSGQPYRDPQTGELLGYEARRLGVAVVSGQQRQVAVLRVEHSLADIRPHDRLFPLPERRSRAALVAHTAENGVTARIIRFFDRISSVARYDVVVINRGERDGVEPGALLSVYRPGALVSDRQGGTKLRLPRREVGRLLLYRVFDKVSYGLVTQSARPIYMKDIVADLGNDH